MVFGGVPAILRDKPLAGIAFGTCLLWAALGFGYSTLRTFVLNDSDFAGDRRTASTIAASVAGAARGALRMNMPLPMIRAGLTHMQKGRGVLPQELSCSRYLATAASAYMTF